MITEEGYRDGYRRGLQRRKQKRVTKTVTEESYKDGYRRGLERRLQKRVPEEGYRRRLQKTVTEAITKDGYKGGCCEESNCATVTTIVGAGSHGSANLGRYAADVEAVSTHQVHLHERHFGPWCVRGLG